MTDYSKLDYLGVVDGVYYFRDAGSSTGPAYDGDFEDYLAWGRAMMTTDTFVTTHKTEKDCASCEVVGICDAHITGGSWHHRQGVIPCKPKISDIVVGS